MFILKKPLITQKTRGYLVILIIFLSAGLVPFVFLWDLRYGLFAAPVVALIVLLAMRRELRFEVSDSIWLLERVSIAGITLLNRKLEVEEPKSLSLSRHEIKHGESHDFTYRIRAKYGARTRELLEDARLEVAWKSSVGLAQRLGLPLSVQVGIPEFIVDPSRPPQAAATRLLGELGPLQIRFAASAEYIALNAFTHGLLFMGLVGVTGWIWGFAPGLGLWMGAVVLFLAVYDAAQMWSEWRGADVTVSADTILVKKPWGGRVRRLALAEVVGYSLQTRSSHDMPEDIRKLSAGIVLFFRDGVLEVGSGTPIETKELLIERLNQELAAR